MRYPIGKASNSLERQRPTLRVQARSRQADRDGGNRFRGCRTENRRADAHHAATRLFVVDRVALRGHLAQVLDQRLGPSDALARQGIERAAHGMADHALDRHAGEHRLAAGRAIGRQAHANPETEAEGSRAVAAGNIDDVGAVEYRQHEGFLGHR